MPSLLDPPVIRDFAGELLVPGDDGFEERRPALIARCTGRDDVAAALRHARERGLRVSVGAAGGALMLDLGRMRGVYVDPVRQRARVQGGATWREVDAATQAHGLAVTGARVPSAGVAGFTLGPGSGWLERKLGLASDRLVSARVVTADGDVVTASAGEHPELFWGLRGGGAGLGVVVELEFALAPVGPAVVGGMLGWPAERICEVAAFYGALMGGAPDDLGGGLLFTTAPPAPFVPEALRGRPIVGAIVLWTGPHAEAEEHLAPLRLLRPAFDTVGALPYTAFQALLEPHVGLTALTNPEAGFLTALPSGDLDLPAPPPLSGVLLQPLGGAFARVPGEATPLGRRDARWRWEAPLGWSGAVRRALAPWAAGETRGPAVEERLRALRSDWDPDGVLQPSEVVR